MSDALPIGALLWLGNYALHSTLILGGIALYERLREDASPTRLEMLWKAGLLAGIATASLQTLGVARPVLGNLPIALPASRAVLSDPVREPAPGTRIEAESVALGADEHPAVKFVASTTTSAAADHASADTGESRNGSIAAAGFGLPILALWLAGVLVFGARIACMALAARRELSDREPVMRGPLLDRLQVLASRAGNASSPRLSLSRRIAGPVTLPGSEICIPAWAEARLSPAEIDAMLAHELAHVRRRDSLWLLLALGVHALLFFQPLNALARKRLAALAELSADDWSAALTGNGRALAECLATLAETVGGAPAPAFGVAMARDESDLVRRVRRLLDGTRQTPDAATMLAKIAIAAAIAVAAAMLPGLVLERSFAGTRHFTINDDGDVSLSMSIRTGDVRVELEGEGDIALAPDGSGVTSLSNGSYLDVEMRRGGTERRVRFEGENGGIERRFWVEGGEQPWSADAERFVEEIMPVILRETGLQAEERVAWFLEERGQEALIEEIGLIRSDFVQRMYTSHYAEMATIASMDLRRLLDILADQMGADFELRNALTTIYEAQQPRGDDLAALIAAGRTIGSDFEVRQLLDLAAAALADSSDATAVYLEMASSIGSDFELRHALTPVFDAEIGEEAVLEAIELAGNQIGSDFELRTLLAVAGERVGASTALAEAYLAAAASIGSDFEHRLALLALAEDAALDSNGWRRLLESAQTLGSDFECASLLTEIAPRLPRDQDVVAAYRATVATIGSEFERMRADRAL